MVGQPALGGGFQFSGIGRQFPGIGQRFLPGLPFGIPMCW
jgi:hypothetical protein